MSQDAAPTDGMLRFAGLPMAENRTEAYRIIREAGPITKSPRGYVISSSEYAEYALKHPELFSSKQAFDLGSPLPLVPIAFDPPEHTRFRRILQPFVGPRESAVWQPRVRSLVGTLIDSFVERGHCDLVAELAIPLPADVFLTLFGLPSEDRDRLIAWKDGLLASPMLSGGRPTEEVVQVGAELFSYLVGHIEERRRHPDAAEDLLGRLLADTSAERLSDEELLGLSFLFVLAGLDTVTSALSTAFAALAAQPRLRQQIAADPSVIPDAVEELLRVDGPVVFLPRVASQDIELGGHAIAAGSRIQVAIAAASRDPTEHPDPDEIDLRRQERHYAFGAGPHRCLGSHLARMEMREVLAEWHSRIPDYELAPGFTPRVEWPTGLVGLDTLPLVFRQVRPHVSPLRAQLGVDSVSGVNHTVSRDSGLVVRPLDNPEEAVGTPRTAEAAAPGKTAPVKLPSRVAAAGNVQGSGWLPPSFLTRTWVARHAFSLGQLSASSGDSRQRVASVLRSKPPVG